MCEHIREGTLALYLEVLGLNSASLLPGKSVLGKSSISLSFLFLLNHTINNFYFRVGYNYSRRKQMNVL